MSIEQKECELIGEFNQFDDWMDKYEYLIDCGKSLPEMAANYKCDENIIKGCQSTVWLYAELVENKVIFHGAADSLIARGIVALLIRLLSGENPEDIVHAKLESLRTIGLQEHLSPTRSNGLVAMVKQMKMYALGLNIAK